MNPNAVIDLTTYGYDDHFAAEFAKVATPGSVPARVIVEFKRYYTVICEHGELTGEIVRRMLHRMGDETELPKVGDWVVITALPDEGRAVIEAVLPRRTTIGRILGGGRKTISERVERQVIATNVDTVFVVATPDETFSIPRIERFVLMATKGGARPVVVLNKSDLCSFPEEYLDRICAISSEIVPLAVSARSGSGIEQLGRMAASCTSVFVGPSGVGKSTIINRLAGGDHFRTGEVRESDNRGKHTTTRRELIVLPGGGIIIDTPGIREVHVSDEIIDLSEAFPEIAKLAAGCRFRDCTHTHESGCSVKAAVEEGIISSARLTSYEKLASESKRAVDGKALLSRAAERKKGKAQAKALKVWMEKRRK